MSNAAEHIAGWQAAGLLDRGDGRSAPRRRGRDDREHRGRRRTPATCRSSGRSARRQRMFGPSVQIAEVFGYLGGGFLLAAWSAFMAPRRRGDRIRADASGSWRCSPPAVLTAIALRLRLRR